MLALQEGLQVMNITVRRNAFGRQVDSYEEDIKKLLVLMEYLGLFLYCNLWVEKIGDGVQVLLKLIHVVLREILLQCVRKKYVSDFFSP